MTTHTHIHALGARISRHAKIRMQQRAVSANVVRFIRAHGDIEMTAGGKCVELRISRDAAMALLANGSATITLVEKALRTALILAHDEGLVTVYPKSATAPCHRRQRKEGGRKSRWGISR